MIAETEGNVHTYFVNEAGDRSEVKVVNGPSGKYLRTTGATESANNLDPL